MDAPAVTRNALSAPYRYDRREIGFDRPDPVLHASDCPDAPPDAYAVGFWPLYGTLDVAASAVALRVHECVPGSDFQSAGLEGCT